MGKSAKAKKEKKKDFQKTKLKVGKTKPKASNVTDASFRAKSINILHQSLSESAPTAESQFSHHLAQLSHKSESQKKESLAFLTTTLQSDSKLQLPPASAILPKVQPLLLDVSNAVRSQCVKLLAALPETAIKPNSETLLLYSRAAITHLSVRIQLTGLDILEWLLNIAGDQVVSGSGGWLKTLNCLLVALSWKDLSVSKSDKGWVKSSVVARTSKSEDNEKLRMRLLVVLSVMLEKGLGETKGLKEDQRHFPYFMYQEYGTLKHSNPYGYLNLFGSVRDEESEQYRDVEDRGRIYSHLISKDVVLGMEKAKKEGGGIGRAAMGVERVLKNVGMD